MQTRLKWLVLALSCLGSATFASAQEIGSICGISHRANQATLAHYIPVGRLKQIDGDKSHRLARVAKLRERNFRIRPS